MITVIFRYLNTFDAFTSFAQITDDGISSFYSTFPNTDSAGFDIFYQGELVYMAEDQTQDLCELVKGSFYFKQYSDVDPSWFWYYDSYNLSSDVLTAQIFDKFSLSSSLKRVDEHVFSTYTFAYVIGELLYLQTLLYT